MIRIAVVTLLLLAVSSCIPFRTSYAAGASQGNKVGKSGLPVPRFVSLRSNKVNLRQGPGKDYPVRWLFKRMNLPVEITAEYEHWRKIRDSQGAEGWVYYRLLTGRRTALIVPWEKTGIIKLYKKDKVDSDIVAQVEPRVLALINKCNGQWCYVTIAGLNGWMQQAKLWGVYAGEHVK